MKITKSDIDEYWENSSQRFFNFYTRLKNEFGRKEIEIEWNIRNAILSQYSEYKYPYDKNKTKISM